MKIFVDTAVVAEIEEFGGWPEVRGFTTNPSLARKAGVRNYREFARDVVSASRGTPVSLEVLADTWLEMNRQARILSDLGENVYVKIPVTNTHREHSSGLVRSLTVDGIKVNVTAIFTLEQVNRTCCDVLAGTPSIVSVFAGRLADIGVDPESVVRNAKHIVKNKAEIEILWASTREIFNYSQALRSNCDIVTMTPELLRKFVSLRKKNSEEYSLETVRMFYDDACAAGFTL